MGQVLITGGSGGADPNDVTARAGDVVKGKTTVDENGEIVNGTIERRGTGGQNAPGMHNDTGSSAISVYLHSGYYEPRNGGADYPYVKVPYSLLSRNLNINASQILNNASIAGVRGSIPIFTGDRVYNGPKVNHGSQRIGVSIPSGYYGGANIYMNYIDIRNALGGLGPNDLRRGKEFLGIRGSLPDANARVVFRDATFYGALEGGLTGPVTNGARLAYHSRIAYLGTNYSALRRRPEIHSEPFKISRTFANYEISGFNREGNQYIFIPKYSFNASEISKIKVRLTINKDSNYHGTHIEVGLMSADLRKSYEYARSNAYETQAHHVLFSASGNSTSGTFEVDVSSIRENVFFYAIFNFNASTNSSDSGRTSHLHMEINEIEFIR